MKIFSDKYNDVLISINDDNVRIKSGYIVTLDGMDNLIFNFQLIVRIQDTYEYKKILDSEDRSNSLSEKKRSVLLEKLNNALGEIFEELNHEQKNLFVHGLLFYLNVDEDSYSDEFKNTDYYIKVKLKEGRLW